MSRISYSEDEDYPGQFALYRANMWRSVASKAGKATLRELRDALLALPRKRLIADAVACDGEVCTVGALLVQRRVNGGEDREVVVAAVAGESEYDDTADYAADRGVKRLIAWKLVELNDMDLRRCTPEERYERVLSWIDEVLADRHAPE